MQGVRAQGAGRQGSGCRASGLRTQGHELYRVTKVTGLLCEPCVLPLQCLHLTHEGQVGDAVREFQLVGRVRWQHLHTRCKV